MAAMLSPSSVPALAETQSDFASWTPAFAVVRHGSGAVK